MYTIFVIDDEYLILSILTKILKEFKINTYDDPIKALADVDDKNKYLFIIDYKMPGLNGLEFLIEIKKKNVAYKAILLTAYAEKEILSKAINNNLIDYIIEKPCEPSYLIQTVTQLLLKIENDDFDLKQEIERLKQENQFVQNIIGLESGLIETFKVVKIIASLNYNVLITGETGTGKEVIVDLIHLMSSRKDKPLIKVNCAAIPENLLESELFGHVKGSFTGADKDKIGKFELADTGTIFLDEIGEMKMDLQAKILRILEDKVIIPLGSNKSKAIDFRLVTATNENLNQAMQENKFRKDLYFRLNKLAIKMPPLRDRKEDILKLSTFFMEKICKDMNIPLKKISRAGIELIKHHNWLGNIRELDNVLMQSIILSYDQVEISKDIINKFMDKNQNDYQKAIDIIALKVVDQKITMDKIEEDVIKAVVKRFDGNVNKASEQTPFSRTKIYRILKESQI